MFRVSRYIKAMQSNALASQVRKPTGPVVIWNLTRRCNLTCKHCYAISSDKVYPGELSTPQIYATLDDLKAFGVPVVILSGGEPLLHPDIWKISAYTRDLGFYTTLSTNGVLIDTNNIGQIVDMRYDYLGISLDGLEKTHDSFRGMQGAFKKSMRAIQLCLRHNIKVGIRFTLTQHNEQEFPAMLDLLHREGIPKFYLSHLNYAGRGNVNRQNDSYFGATRRSLDLLFDQAWRDAEQNSPYEYVTGNNDADGPYLALWATKKGKPTGHVLDHLRQWGGNSSGVNVANIDNLGQVHPDTYWWHYTVGNVKEKPFSEIWANNPDPIMVGLQQLPRQIKGRCASCQYFDICGGNTRTRALQLTGDHWQEDPGCYLTDDEIGLHNDKGRITNTPFSPREQDQDRQWLKAIKNNEQQAKADTK